MVVRVNVMVCVKAHARFRLNVIPKPLGCVKQLCRSPVQNRRSSVVDQIVVLLFADLATKRIVESRFDCFADKIEGVFCHVDNPAADSAANLVLITALPGLSAVVVLCTWRLQQFYLDQ
jgi:hypothetical protein